MYARRALENPTPWFHTCRLKVSSEVDVGYNDGLRPAPRQSTASGDRETPLPKKAVRTRNYEVGAQRPEIAAAELSANRPHR